MKIKSLKLDSPYLNVEILQRDKNSLNPGSRYVYVQNASQSPLGDKVKIEEDELIEILKAIEKM